MSRSKLFLASLAYALLVFAGTAVLGFVIAPLLGIASGRFPIDTDAQAVFSMLTLKGVPYLAGLCALSGLSYRRISQRRLPLRAALFALNVVLAWLIAASIALAILG